MFTAALEHLRTGEGRKVCSAKRKEKQKQQKKRTELKNFDRVFVCNTCTVKDLSQSRQWLNGLAKK